MFHSLSSGCWPEPEHSTCMDGNGHKHISFVYVQDIAIDLKVWPFTLGYSAANYNIFFANITYTVTIDYRVNTHSTYALSYLLFLLIIVKT